MEKKAKVGDKAKVVSVNGGGIGPDLSNLVHRDYASVLADVQARHAGDALSLELGQRVAGPRVGDDPLDQADLRRRVDPLDATGVGQDPPQHPVDRPLDGGDRGDAQSLVDGGAALVVDAGHHPVDRERLTGDSGDHDVGVVTVGDRRKRTGLLDACVEQPGPVEADPDDGAAAEVRRQATERLGPAIDGGYTLIGMSRMHARLFADIPWSTEDVYRTTVQNEVQVNNNSLRQYWKDQLGIVNNILANTKENHSQCHFFTTINVSNHMLPLIQCTW